MKRVLVGSLVLALLLSSSSSCSRRSSEKTTTGPMTTSVDNGQAGGAKSRAGCFTIVQSTVRVGEAPSVKFDRPLAPRKGERYWLTLVKAGAPDRAWGKWHYLEAGASQSKVKVPDVPGEHEIRLHDGYPRLKFHVVCRRSLVVEPGPKAKAHAPHEGVCITVQDTPIQAQSVLKVHFSQPLDPPSGQHYYLALVAAGEVDGSLGNFTMLKTGATTASIGTRYATGAYEVRLHGGYMPNHPHPICRRPVTIVPAPDVRQLSMIHDSPKAMADATAAQAFAAAAPKGSVDSTFAPLRWTIEGLPSAKAIVVGRYRTNKGLQMALVAVPHGAAPTPQNLIDLPATHSAELSRVVDLDAKRISRAADAGAPTQPDNGIVIPTGRRYPALLLTTTSPEGKSSTDIVAVALWGKRPRVVLSFPLRGTQSGGGTFSTIRGPDLAVGPEQLLQLELVQHAHPRTPRGRPGPPTHFVCSWGGKQYTCGR